MVELDKSGVATAGQSVGDGVASVYQMMAVGVGLAGAVAYWTATNAGLMAFAKSGMGTLILFAVQLGLIFCIGKIVKNWGAQGGAIAFYVIAATMGLSLAPIAHAYTGASLARSFAIACAVLGAASYYGSSTKRSLASVGGFMFIGLIGIILAAIVNIFLQSTIMQMVLDAMAIIIFTGLAAWDTQRIRNELERATPEEAQRIIVFGALSMWLNLVNLFTAITRLTGERE